MKKYVTIKESNTNTNRDAFASFWEQMLLDKIQAYGLEHHIQPSYSVVQETEKAVQIIVPANTMYRYTCSGSDFVEYTGHDWQVWMPKKAMIDFEKVEA